MEFAMTRIDTALRSRGLFARGLAALVVAACGVAFVASPAAAQNAAPDTPAGKQHPKKKPAPRKPAAKKPQKKKAAPRAVRKPAAKPQPPRVVQAPAPKFSTDTESTITRPGDHAFAIQYGGMTRTYVIHVPRAYNIASPAALVVLLHGGADNPDLLGNEPAYGLKAKSDREGFIAVFPNGTGKPASWNAGNCCGTARAQNVDDVGFIRQVVTNVFRQMSIDRARIFAAGISDGGMMAYRLACEVPDLWRAVAAVAATDRTRDCSPATPVSVLHIHAKDDRQIPLAGAASPDAAEPTVAPPAMSVSDTVAKWAQLDGCTAQPRHILDKGSSYCEAYSYCRGKAEVQLCVAETGGHSWPGGKAAKGAGPQPFSATDLIWDFFSRR
jgi:polyhydroxybutyrate depolymerase